MKKRVRITIETERVLIVHQPSIATWCNVCQKNVPMLTVGQASLAGQVSPMTVYGWAQEGKLHYKESDQALLLICSDSLNRSLEGIKNDKSS